MNASNYEEEERAKKMINSVIFLNFDDFCLYRWQLANTAVIVSLFFHPHERERERERERYISKYDASVIFSIVVYS